MNFTKINRTGLAILAIALALLLIPASAYAQERHNTTLYFFWGIGCPHCENQKPFLEELDARYPELEIQSYEVWYNQENAKLFSDMAEALGTRASGVPTTFIDDQVWVGYSSRMNSEIENKVIDCIEHGCPDPMEKLISEEKTSAIVITNGETVSPLGAVCVHVFIHGDCPQCEEILPFLQDLETKFNIELEIHDVLISENKELYEVYKKTYGLTYGAYPIVFIGERFLIGGRDIRENLENEIISCGDEGCTCPTEKIKSFLPQIPKISEHTPEDVEILELPLIGEIDISSMSMTVFTVLVSFVDGFNPCSLWVLTFLLGIVIYSGSRKRIALIGLTYLTVTSIVYGLFIVGMLNVFTYIGFVGWIRAIVVIFALTFATVNIKDFFWYKKGISFTIPDKYKPKIFRDMRNVMDPQKSIYSMILATVVMALGITLVELPCTAGFPVLWTGLIASRGISMLSGYFVFLLAVYLSIYLSIELIIFFGTVFTLKKTKFEEKHGRLLKLIGGAIMLALGLVFAFKPEYMESISATFTVFISAIIISAVAGILYKKFVGFKEDKSENTEVQDENKDGKNKESLEIKSEDEVSEEKSENKKDGGIE